VDQNEINYIDLALKSVASERFPALTAIFKPVADYQKAPAGAWGRLFLRQVQAM
jgi:hypothetical protein